MQIKWKKILTERKKCHQVKKNVSSDRNNCVIWSKKCINQLKICFNQSKTCSSKSKKCVYRSKKYYQPVEKKVATERKQESANWTKKGITRSKWKIRLDEPILLRKFPSDRQKFLSIGWYVISIPWHFDSIVFRLENTSTRKHFDSKVLNLCEPSKMEKLCILG